MWTNPFSHIYVSQKMWRGFSVLLFYFTASPFPNSFCFLSSSQEQSVMWTPPPTSILITYKTWRGSLSLFYFYSGQVVARISLSLLNPFSTLPDTYFSWTGLLRENAADLGQSAAHVLVSATCLLVATLETPESFYFW